MTKRPNFKSLKNYCEKLKLIRNKDLNKNSQSSIDSKFILSVKDLALSYGAIKALKGISFDVERGSIVSLIGANGAGKSSLLNSTIALVSKQEGSIYYNDGTDTYDIGKLKTNDITKLGISLVPEGRRVFPQLTVDENLDMGAFTIQDRGLIEKRKEEMFSIFDILKKRREQKASTLSGGEQQMLAIARALMISPKLLLLDEPGLGLAPLMVEVIFDIVTRINKEKGVTILLVEQNAKMALSVSTKAFVMENGLITIEGAGKELLNNEKVRQAYLG